MIRVQILEQSSVPTFCTQCLLKNSLAARMNHIRNKDIAYLGGARGVMVIVIGNGHGDTSSNPGRG